MSSRLAAGTALGLLLSAALLTGCGQDAPVSRAASAVLTTDVARLKAAATSGTSGDVARAADRLRVDVGAQQARGELSSARATAILEQLSRVLADTAARPAPRPTPTPTRSEGDGDHGKGKGRGKGGD